MSDFGLDEDRRAILEMARTFAAERIAPNALEWDERRHFPVEILREAAALGMGAIYCAEEHGGSGLTRLDAALIFEALATGCPTVSAYLSIHNMATWMVDRFGSSDLRARLVPALASMEAIAAYALTEPGAGSDAAALATRAVLDGDTYVLNGTKQFISGGGAADWYVTMVRTDGEGPSGITALAVPKKTPGLSFGPNERKMGWNAQPTAQLVFQDARVPADHRIGAEGDGFKIAMKGLDGGRLNIAACSIGGASAALEASIAYMKERRAFGKRLDQFQALQFRLADMGIELEAARSFLWRAAQAFDGGSPEATTLAAMAKRFVTDAGSRIANEALQLHGGYGYLAEYGIEKIVRDLRVHQILEGTNEIMRLIVARQMLEERG